MRIRIAVVGCGKFGQQHLRVLRELDGVELAGILDQNDEAAQLASERFGVRPLRSLDELARSADAAVVATPTSTHGEVGSLLLARGLDVLIEKPIAHTLEAAQALVETARRQGRILQVGHLERFNPVVQALQSMVRLPLFFEIHRMSPFTARSLDVDVVLDLMIHDLDIVLALTGERPAEIRAAGLPIMTDKLDIANVRLMFPSGCVANLTASRVSTERIRKLRMFQPHEYVSIDYQRQQGVAFSVNAQREVRMRPLEAAPAEPLRLELEAFVECVRTRARPLVDGEDAVRALECALAILATIEEHLRVVSQTVARRSAT